MDERYLGIDIGGTKTALVVGDAQAETRARVQFATQVARGPEAITAEIVEHGRELLREHRVRSAGVSCGGPLDPIVGLIQSPPNLPGWDDIPLQKILQEAWQMPVRIQNDANAGALAEWRFGSGRGCRNFVFLTFGTGLGAGLILNGALYEGSTFLAGEVGHIRIAEEGPVAYGKTGGFESFCSGPGLERLAKWQIAKYGAEVASLDAREISTRALAGDPDCVDLVAECGVYLGRGLAILIDILNPDAIAIGGMAVRLGDLLLQPAREIIAHEALPAIARVCRLLPAQLGERIGDVACLCVAMTARG